MCDVIDLVNDVIYQSQMEQYNVYMACGCGSCSRKAADIKASMACSPKPKVKAKSKAKASNRPSLCPGCLKVSETPCPYCGDNKVSS